MPTKSSTGFVAAILGASSFDEVFRNGAILVYTGGQPESADAAATGTLIGRITAGGGAWTAGSEANGLRFERQGRYAYNSSDQTWKLTGLATGTAGWFRLVGNAADSGGASTVLPRIDGSIGLEDDSTAQLILPDTALTASSSVEISQWFYAIPPLGA